MNKKILVGLLLTTLTINNIQPSFTGFAIKSLTDLFRFTVIPKKLAKYGIPQAGLKGIVATSVAFIAIDIMIRKTAGNILPESIAQYLTEDIQEVKDQHEQEVAYLQNEHKQEVNQLKNDINTTQYTTALATSAILGTIWAINKYKDPIINWFKNQLVKT